MGSHLKAAMQAHGQQPVQQISGVLAPLLKVPNTHDMLQGNKAMGSHLEAAMQAHGHQPVEHALCKRLWLCGDQCCQRP